MRSRKSGAGGRNDTVKYGVDERRCGRQNNFKNLLSIVVLDEWLPIFVA